MRKLTRIKPATKLAKADAALTAGYRKIHPKYDEDVARYGRRVADFNAGFLKGDAQRKAKQRKRK
jgi:hypothetical protein